MEQNPNKRPLTFVKERSKKCNSSQVSTALPQQNKQQQQPVVSLVQSPMASISTCLSFSPVPLQRTTGSIEVA